MNFKIYESELNSTERTGAVKEHLCDSEDKTHFWENLANGSVGYGKGYCFRSRVIAEKVNEILATEGIRKAWSFARRMNTREIQVRRKSYVAARSRTRNVIFTTRFFRLCARDQVAVVEAALRDIEKDYGRHAHPEDERRARRQAERIRKKAGKYGIRDRACATRTGSVAEAEHYGHERRN